MLTKDNSNLTIASHVIFFAPYLTIGSSGQTTYESNMKQAIGRAVRYGQRRVVKIYHLMTARTVDVDIFEQRHKQHVAWNEDTQEYERRPLGPSSKPYGEFASCVPHLVHDARGSYKPT